MNNKNEIGCIFVKHGNYGEYLSIKVEIDGVTHNLTAFQSKYYEDGGKKPKYYIPAPKIESNQSAPVDKYQSQLDNVMSQKAANEKLKAIASSDPQIAFTSEDVPF